MGEFRLKNERIGINQEKFPLLPNLKQTNKIYYQFFDDQIIIDWNVMFSLKVGDTGSQKSIKLTYSARFRLACWILRIFLTNNQTKIRFNIGHLGVGNYNFTSDVIQIMIQTVKHYKGQCHQGRQEYRQF